MLNKLSESESESYDALEIVQEATIFMGYKMLFNKYLFLFKLIVFKTL